MTPPSESRPQMFDPVNNPLHYSSGGVEAIEALEACMTPEAFRGFLKGNVIKYVWRYENKNGLEDLKKAKWYLKALIFALEMEQEKEALEAIEGNCKDGFCPMPGASSPDTIVGVRFDNPLQSYNFFDPVHDG
jgi:hypothetical protein